MPLNHYQKQSLWSPLWLPIAVISVRIKCQGPTVLPQTQCCSTAMSTDPSKSWLLGEGGSQSASLTFAFVLYKVRVTIISNLWKRITYKPLVGRLQWRSGKEFACNAGDVGSGPWVRKIPWRREWQPTSVFLPGESHGQRSLAGYSPWGCKESNTVEQLSNENEPLGAADHLLRVHFSDNCLSQPIANLSLWTASSPQTKFFHPCLRALAILSDCKSLPGPSANPTSHTHCWTTASQSLHLCIPVTSSGKPSLTTPSPRWGFPDSSVGKESACNAEDPGLIPGLGRSPGEGIGYSLQYSWASPAALLVKNLPSMQETWVWSLGWKDPLEKGKATHSSILVWRIPQTV